MADWSKRTTSKPKEKKEFPQDDFEIQNVSLIRIGAVYAKYDPENFEGDKELLHTLTQKFVSYINLHYDEDEEKSRLVEEVVK